MNVKVMCVVGAAVAAAAAVAVAAYVATRTPVEVVAEPEPSPKHEPDAATQQLVGGAQGMTEPVRAKECAPTGGTEVVAVSAVAAVAVASKVIDQFEEYSWFTLDELPEDERRDLVDELEVLQECLDKAHRRAARDVRKGRITQEEADRDIAEQIAFTKEELDEYQEELVERMNWEPPF